MIFLFYTSVRLLNVLLLLSRGASKILFLPLLLDTGVTCSIPRDLLSNFFMVGSL